MPTLPSRTLSIRVERPWREVYDFLASPVNFALWASGLGDGLVEEGGVWRAATPDGPVTIGFTPPNTFGIADHEVRLPAGATVSVPMRVIANGAGAEVLLTLFRQPDMTDETFARDAQWVERDLAALKALLEGDQALGPSEAR